MDLFFEIEIFVSIVVFVTVPYFVFVYALVTYYEKKTNVANSFGKYFYVENVDNFTSVLLFP